MSLEIKEGHYKLVKKSAEVKSERGYPDSYNVLDGTATLLTVGEDVCLYVSNHKEWFRTSPIQKILENDTGYKIYTRNSVYELVK